MANGQEQRQHFRLKDRVKVVFRLVGGSAMTQNLNELEAVTKDISEGGIFIELKGKNISGTGNIAIDNFLLFKSVLDMKIHLPDLTAPVNVKGKAVWIEKQVPGQDFRHGVAVAFTEVEGDGNLAIRSHIEKNVPDR